MREARGLAACPCPGVLLRQTFAPPFGRNGWSLHRLVEVTFSKFCFFILILTNTRVIEKDHGYLGHVPRKPSPGQIFNVEHPSFLRNSVFFFFWPLYPNDIPLDDKLWLGALLRRLVMSLGAASIPASTITVGTLVVTLNSID